MRRILLVIAVMTVTAGPAAANTRPPQITWDWFNVAEVYKRYPRRSRADLLIAAHYHRMAADRGNASSAYKLAEMYEHGLGVAQSYGTAFRWYLASAELGDRYAEFRVGYFYQKGLGIARDVPTALYWYARSARQDNAWAYHMLAFMFADADGVEEDVALARSYFEISLPRTNDHWAKWRLATLIIDSDPARARRLLRQSAAQGNANAREVLDRKGW